MSAIAELTTVVMDCADPAPLAEFYRAVTGWKVTYSDEERVHLGNGAGVDLAFQQVEGYEPPTWPGVAKQAHLDLKVRDLTLAVKKAKAVGATKPDFQPGGDEWVVLADPEGHLFCLIASD
jgi:catechol 2,3-dioxygenase-like lactoylglutathione lyase family enzyme